MRRSNNINKNVSEVSAIKIVRDFMVKFQREMSFDIDCVLEGRDIGTKVIPEAKLKLFITASIDIRAQRRYNELFKKGDDISLEQVRKNINDRDSYDINRSINPLIQAKDAVLIDNTDLSFEDQEILIDNCRHEIN